MKKMSSAEREALLLALASQVLEESLTPGEMLRKLRKDVLQMNQDRYAGLVGISRRTLSDLEKDQGNPSVALLNSAFKPFGLKMSVLPRSQSMLNLLLEKQVREKKPDESF